MTEDSTNKSQSLRKFAISCPNIPTTESVARNFVFRVFYLFIYFVNYVNK